jgi:hypothetical protein
MTMSGNFSAADTVGPLVDDSLPPSPPGPIQQAVDAILNLIHPVNRELLTLLKGNTPIKITNSFTVPANGILGGGVATPDLSLVIWTAPMSSEAWLNRIMITSPQHLPSAPLTTGALALVGSTMGEIIVTAPDSPAANTIPIQFTESLNSAPHLDRGEKVTLSGTGLTAGDIVRVDLQIVLLQGISELTPKRMSPTDLTAKDATSPF